MTRYILTGAPGAGKTSVLRALDALGCATVAEAATEVVAVEQAKGNDEPWQDISFIESILEVQRRRQREVVAEPGQAVFFDRAPLDTLALYRWLGFEGHNDLIESIRASHREGAYSSVVFLLENLGFCEPTTARRISYEESVRFKQFHEQVYAQAGCRIVRIARGPIHERAAAILGHLQLDRPD